MQCMLFGDTITFAPNIKNWWQAITVGAINTSAKVVEGALFGAMVGMGAGLLKGLTQLAMPTLSSVGVNIIGSFGTLGSSVRAVFGIQNATHTWAMGSDLISTKTSEAFFDGAIPEYESIKRIGTGNAEPQDAMMLLYLLHLKTPTPKEKPVTEEPVKNNNITEPEPVKKKGDGEAFEAEPLKPNTPEHKAQRWKDYENRMKDNPKKYSYERWSKQYDTNMKNVSHGLSREQAYRDALGGVSETVKTPHTNRQIDISKPEEMYAGQLKTGKLGLTKQTKIDILKDGSMVKDGYKVEYILEKGGSKPLLEALKKNGIDYHIGTKLP